jgi:hypothetical protein
MAVSTPRPTESFLGIDFNPSFWISNTTSLTQDVANQLYLRKTTTDSASALETFNGGVKTNELSAISGDLNINYSSPASANSIYIGNGFSSVYFNGAAPAEFVDGLTSSTYNLLNGAVAATMFSSQTAEVNLFGNLSASTLRLGNQTTPQSCHISQVDCSGSQINNAVNNNSGNLSVGNLQTSGILNIGTSTTRTGNINIGSGAGAGNTSSIQLGSSTGSGAISVNRPLTIGYTVNPVAGQIGEVIRAPALTPTAFPTGTAVAQTAAVSVNYLTLPRGVWYTSATMGLSCSTVAGTLSQTSVYIQQISPTVLVANQRDDVPAFTAPGGSLVFNIKNSSGVLVMTGSNTVRLSYEMTYVGLGAVYTTTVNNFSWLFTRIA